MMTQKHNILSIVVLNMAKYTIISLILTDFVPSPKLILTPISKNSQVQKVPKFHLGGVGGHLHFGPSPKFQRFL